MLGVGRSERGSVAVEEIGSHLTPRRRHSLAGALHYVGGVATFYIIEIDFQQSSESTQQSIQNGDGLGIWCTLVSYSFGLEWCHKVNQRKADNH